MSYASRLLAMSRDRVPAITPRVAGDEMPAEEIVEVPVVAPPSQPRRAETPAPRPQSGAAAAVVREVGAARAESAGVEPSRAERTIERTVERHVVAAQAKPQTIEIAASPPSISFPPQAQWLVEDSRGPDPLVETADNDALRDLMRTVRQWTSSPPTVIESHAESASPPEPATVAAQPPANQISIGNVTITVDDVPPHPERAGSPVRSTANRMARHLIREP